MKRIFTLMLLCGLFAIAAQAQRFALIDMEYIMENIPAYATAQKQLQTASAKWQKEVEQATTEAKALYEEYQSLASALSDAQKQQKEDAIVAKEKEANELRRKYFGQEGELYKLQQSLIAPIEDKIYVAVKQIAIQEGYALVLDRASDNSIIFASPTIDMSDDVLDKLGY